MSDDASYEILVACARALAHADPPEHVLQLLLGSMAGRVEFESAAILVPDAAGGHLEIAASIGLPDPAAAGLASAVRNAAHPIARTFATPVASFDVLPTAPGGPALRTHLPVVVTRGGSDVALGVLALAHERPVEPAGRILLQAIADLAAVAIERRQRVPLED